MTVVMVGCAELLRLSRTDKHKDWITIGETPVNPLWLSNVAQSGDIPVRPLCASGSGNNTPEESDKCATCLINRGFTGVYEAFLLPFHRYSHCYSLLPASQTRLKPALNPL